MFCDLNYGNICSRIVCRAQQSTHSPNPRTTHLPLPPSLPPWAPPQTTTLKHKHPPGRTLHQLRARATNLAALSPTHPSHQTSCTLWARQSYRGQPPSVTQRRLTRAYSFPLPASVPAPTVAPLASHHHQVQHRSADRSTITRQRTVPPPQRDHPPSTITLSSPGLAIPSHKTAPHSRAAAPALVPAPPPAPPAQDAKTRPPRPTATPP